MSLTFLSSDWFAKAKELRDAAGDLDVPAALADVVINVTVSGGPDGDVDVALVAGMIEEGHQADAGTTMFVPADLAQRILVDGDQAAGMQGFMSGEIRVEGDMSKLMVLQTAPPSAAQVALMKQIAEITA